MHTLIFINSPELVIKLIDKVPVKNSSLLFSFHSFCFQLSIALSYWPSLSSSNIYPRVELLVFSRNTISSYLNMFFSLSPPTLPSKVHWYFHWLGIYLKLSSFSNKNKNTLSGNAFIVICFFPSVCLLNPRLLHYCISIEW